MDTEIDIKTHSDKDAPYFNKKRWGYKPEGIEDRNDTFEFICEYINRFNGSTFSCLDLGAGPGMWCEYLVKEGCDKYVAIDISDKMLELCNANKTIAHSFEIITHDLNDGLPVGLQSFDLIIAIHSLEYIVNIRPLLCDAMSLLKRNGIIVIVTKSKRAYIWRLYKFVFDLFASSKLAQKWRSRKDFDFLNCDLEYKYLNIRIPTMINNVNSTYKFKGDGKKIRNFISRYINPILKKLNIIPFAWHIGIALIKK